MSTGLDGERSRRIKIDLAASCPKSQRRCLQRSPTRKRLRCRGGAPITPWVDSVASRRGRARGRRGELLAEHVHLHLTDASAEEGRVLLDHLVTELVAAVTARWPRP